jgi:hypothetical protein
MPYDRYMMRYVNIIISDSGVTWKFYGTIAYLYSIRLYITKNLKEDTIWYS